MLDVAVGHAGDVVGYGAGEALGGDLRLVVGGELRGVGDEGGEEALDDARGVGVGVFHSDRVVEVVVKEALGLGALGFCLRAEGGETAWGAANVFEGDGGRVLRVEGGYPGADFVHQIGDEQVEDALEGFVDGEFGRGEGVLLEDGVVEAAKEGHGGADLLEVEDAGVEAVVEVGGEVGDFVRQIDELGFERGELIEKVLGQFGVVGGGVVAGVLDDAFAYGEGQVEAAKGGVSLFEPGGDAQGVKVVVEVEAVRLQRQVEGFFACVAEGGVADVVNQGEAFGEFGIEAQGRGEGAGDLGDFKSVREAIAEVVRKRCGGRLGGEAGEDLCLAGEAAEGAGVEDACGVAGKGGAVRMRGLGVGAAGEGMVRGAGDGDACGELERRDGCGVGHGFAASDWLREAYVWLYRRGVRERPAKRWLVLQITMRAGFEWYKVSQAAGIGQGSPSGSTIQPHF